MTKPHKREALEKIDKAWAMVSALCKPRGTAGAREWLMSIPADPDRDPDLVIVDALYAARRALVAPSEEQGARERKRCECGLGVDIAIYEAETARLRARIADLVPRRAHVESEESHALAEYLRHLVQYAKAEGEFSIRIGVTNAIRIARLLSPAAEGAQPDGETVLAAWLQIDREAQEEATHLAAELEYLLQEAPLRDWAPAVAQLAEVLGFHYRRVPRCDGRGVGDDRCNLPAGHMGDHKCGPSRRLRAEGAHAGERERLLEDALRDVGRQMGTLEAASQKLDSMTSGNFPHHRATVKALLMNTNSLVYRTIQRALAPTETLDNP